MEETKPVTVLASSSLMDLKGGPPGCSLPSLLSVEGLIVAMLPMNPMINKDTQRVTVRGYGLLMTKDLFKLFGLNPQYL